MHHFMYSQAPIWRLLDILKSSIFNNLFIESSLEIIHSVCCTLACNEGSSGGSVGLKINCNNISYFLLKIQNVQTFVSFLWVKLWPLLFRIFSLPTTDFISVSRVYLKGLNYESRADYLCCCETLCYRLKRNKGKKCHMDFKWHKYFP